MGKTKSRGNGEGSIYQRESDKKWVCAITVGINPETGKPKRKYIYGDTKNEVKDQLIRKRAEQQQGINIDPPRQTVAKYLEFWLESVKGQVRASTYSKYEMHVRLHIVPRIGRRQMGALLPHHVQEMVNWLSKRELAPSTVASALATLMVALNHAVRLDMVPRNVAAQVPKPRIPKKELNALTVAEAQRLLLAIHGERLEALFVVSLSLGLRRGEALGLKWEDIDLDRGKLAVHRGLQRVEHKLEFVEPKSKSALRSITLPATTIAILRQHKKRQEAERERAGENWQDQGLVFPAMNARGHVGGGPFDPRNYKRSLDRVLANAKLDPMRVHDLRHTAASLLLAQGVDIKMISELLGHSNIRITLEIYGHLYETTRQETANKMDFILGYVPETDPEEAA